jgi:hypothetical protein
MKRAFDDGRINCDNLKVTRYELREIVTAVNQITRYDEKVEFMGPKGKITIFDNKIVTAKHSVV